MTLVYTSNSYTAMFEQRSNVAVELSAIIVIHALAQVFAASESVDHAAGLEQALADRDG